MRACGCGERSTAAHSRPSAHRSAAYGKVPSVLAAASAGGSDTPSPCGGRGGLRPGGRGDGGVVAVGRCRSCGASVGPVTGADAVAPPGRDPPRRVGLVGAGRASVGLGCASRSAATRDGVEHAPVAGAAAQVAGERLRGSPVRWGGGCPPAGRARSWPCRGRRSRTGRRRTRRARAGRPRVHRRRPGPRRCGPRCLRRWRRAPGRRRRAARRPGPSRRRTRPARSRPWRRRGRGVRAARTAGTRRARRR